MRLVTILPALVFLGMMPPVMAHDYGYGSSGDAYYRSSDPPWRRPRRPALAMVADD